MQPDVWLERMRRRPVHPVRRIAAACWWHLPLKPLPDAAPPPGLEGFGQPALARSVSWYGWLRRSRAVSWSSADGRIQAEVFDTGVSLSSQLGDGRVVLTWPGDAAGRAFAAADDPARISLVGSGSLAADVRRHAEVLRALEDQGVEVVELRDLAARHAARRVYTLHQSVTDFWIWAPVLDAYALVVLGAFAVAAAALVAVVTRIAGAG